MRLGKTKHNNNNKIICKLFAKLPHFSIFQICCHNVVPKVAKPRINQSSSKQIHSQIAWPVNVSR